MRTSEQPESRVTTVFDIAWIGVVIAAYGGFLGDGGRPVPTWQLAVCLTCGVFTATATFVARRLDIEATPTRLGTFFVVACTLVATALATSGLPGSFGILPLPLVSYAAFILRWHAATLVIVILYGAVLGAYRFTYGNVTFSGTAVPYGSAYLFTVVLSLAGRQAFAARAKAEMLSRELTDANTRLHEQARQADALATARERNRLAREIHDGLGHYLTVIKVQLDAASAMLGSEPDAARRSVDTAARLTGEALEDVRRSVGALRSDAAPRPLVETVQHLATRCEPKAHVTCTGATRPVDPAIAHALIRALQEGLTNVRKHAHATSVSVHLDFQTAGRVRLEVIDDGVGPGGGRERGGTGFGLNGLRERFALLSGTIELRPRTPRGSSLVAEVPA